MKLPKPRQRGNSWSISIMVHGTAISSLALLDLK